MLYFFLNLNWLMLMIYLNFVDIFCLNISFLKSFIMVLVREIGLSCVYLVIGDFFGIGLIFVVF